MLGHRDLLCTGYHPAAAGHTAPSPLWGAERLPKRSDLSQRVLVRERSLNPASPSGALLLQAPIGSARRVHTQSLFSLQSMKWRHRQHCRSEQPPVPSATSPSHYTCRTEAAIFP